MSLLALAMQVANMIRHLLDSYTKVSGKARCPAECHTLQLGLADIAGVAGQEATVYKAAYFAWGLRAGATG